MRQLDVSHYRVVGARYGRSRLTLFCPPVADVLAYSNVMIARRSLSPEGSG